MCDNGNHVRAFRSFTNLRFYEMNRNVNLLQSYGYFLFSAQNGKKSRGTEISGLTPLYFR